MKNGIIIAVLMLIIIAAVEAINNNIRIALFNDDEDFLSDNLANDTKANDIGNLNNNYTANSTNETFTINAIKNFTLDEDNEEGYIEEKEFKDTESNATVIDYEVEIKKVNKTDFDEETVLINQNFCNFKNLTTNVDASNSNKSHTNNATAADGKDKIINAKNKVKFYTFNYRNSISFNNNTNHSVNDTLNSTNTNNKTNINSADSLLNIIADQSEAIKKEICVNCLEISSALDILVQEIKEIKNRLKKIINKNKNDNSKLNLARISNIINNINFIKADLFKLNEILNTLQKANCDNFNDNSKKYQLVVNSTNKLVEIMQDVLKKLNININLVILN